MNQLIVRPFGGCRVVFDEELLAFGVGEHFQLAEARVRIGQKAFQQFLIMSRQALNVRRRKQFRVVVEIDCQAIGFLFISELDFVAIDAGVLFEDREFDVARREATDGNLLHG